MAPPTASQARVKSVNVGIGVRLGRPLAGQISGIDKRPVQEISVRDPGPIGTGVGSGVTGDLSCGFFGENVTTMGVDVDALLIGSRVRVGSTVVLEVCGPRVPCATFAAHMGERSWVKRFTQRGRPGTYCAVRTPGRIRVGDSIEVIDVPDHDIDIATLFRARHGDRSALRRVLDACCMPPEDDAWLAELLDRLERPARTSLSEG